jgi:ABC-type phosphate transport system substrate-binding protein
MKFPVSFLLAPVLALLAMGAAHAEVVVVVSAKSPVESLTSAQASQIFLAKSGTLPGGGAATPIDIASGPARDEFYAKVTGKDAAQLKAYWAQLTFTGKAKPFKQAPNAAAAKALIAGSPTAIGYLAPGDVDASVRVVLKP